MKVATVTVLGAAMTAACTFPSYMASAGSFSSDGGVTTSGGAAGSGASSGGIAGGGSMAGTPASAGTSDVGGAGGSEGGASPDSPTETLTSVDLRGNCDGGSPDTPGATSTVEDLRSYDVTAYGSQIGHACGEDQGRFVYLQIEGDFDVAVQITSMDNFGLLQGQSSARPVKAGLMVREGLQPSARYLGIWAAQPTDNFPDAFQFDFRSLPGGHLGVAGFDYAWLNMQDAIFDRQLPNIWVRLRRERERVYAFASEDGQTWIAPSQPWFDNDFGPTVYVGIAASSAEDGGYAARSVTRFRNLSGFDTLAPLSPPPAAY